MRGSKGSTSAAPIMLLIVGLLIGSGGGYLIVSNSYQPKIQDYEKRISELTSEVSTLESENANYETTISNLETQLDAARETILKHVSRISSLETQASAYQSQVANQRDSITSMQYEIDDLESQLDDIMEVVVTQHYEWEYGTGYYASEWFWDLPISLETYFEYYFRPRPTYKEDWVDMVKDPYDDYYISSMVQKINEAAIKKGFTESEKVNFVIAFVQSLPYTEDSVTTDWDEYPRYPIETLFDRGGDCEDTSILVATLLDRMGYDVCLLILEGENHCAVGVAMEGVYGSFYRYDDKEYFYLETTGEGWEIGEIPTDFTDTRAYIYPLNP